MKPIALLASMLMLSAVMGREVRKIEEKQAETEPPMDDKANMKETVLCGDIQKILTHVKRWDSRLNDKDTSDDNVDEKLNLDKRSGGNYITYGEIPWQVTISNGMKVCEGAIISEFWVISAAYCFYGTNPSVFGVTVGNHRLWYENLKEKTYNVATIIIHEVYQPQQSDYDISLIKIKATDDGRGIEFNDYVQPVCLAKSTETLLAGSPIILSGWGFTSGGYRRSEMLKKAILPVVTYDSCKKFYMALTSNMFCAGYLYKGVDVCREDRGSPAVATSGKSYTLYGIVSFGNGCTRPLLPAAFSSIAAYRNWIDASITLNSDGIEANMPVRGVTVT